MLRKITLDRSLMYVQQHHIDKFCAIAERMDKFKYIIEKREATSEDDAWNIVFNTWVSLLPDEFQIIQSVEKSLYYTPNFMVLEALTKDKSFQHLRNRSKGNEELTFLSALTIACGIGQWTINLLKKYDLMDIVERNKKRVYHESHKIRKLELEIYLEDQARFAKAVVKELSFTNSFQSIIKKYCNEAYILYVENFGKQNDKDTGLLQQ